MGISISELQTINNYDTDDVLLISRKNSTTTPDTYETYNYNIKSMCNSISNDVYTQLTSAITTVRNELITKCNNISSTHESELNAHIEACRIYRDQNETIHNQLCGHIDYLSDQIDSLDERLDIANNLNDDNFKYLSSEISSLKVKHQEDINTLRNSLMDWVKANFVDLTSDQNNITGKKTFTAKTTFKEEIDGIAKQAKWS